MTVIAGKNVTENRWPGVSLKVSLLDGWRRARSSARQRSIKFTLTFQQYADWWMTDHRWDRRHIEGLTMCRIDKSEGFTIDNLDCRTRGEDLDEQARTFTDERKRAVRVGDLTFDSVSMAANHYKISQPTATYRAENLVETLDGVWSYADFKFNMYEPRAHDHARKLRAFTQHRLNAGDRGIDFLFTFDEWCDWWETDDRWANRGTRKGCFVMARKNDCGPYSFTNVYCATVEQNAKDRRGRENHWRADDDELAKGVITPKGVFVNFHEALKAHPTMNIHTMHYYAFTKEHGFALAEESGL